MWIGKRWEAIATWWRARREPVSLRPRRTNSFVLLGKDLWRRLKAPLLNFTYWTHLLIGVCFYGSIGIWAELLRHYLLDAEKGYGSIILAMHATYPAIIGATAMQLLLSNEGQTYMRSFAQLVSTVFFSMAAVCVVAAERIGQPLSFRIGAAGLVASVIFWWIANCGRVVSPRTAESQVRGGVVWAIGAALREETGVDARFGGWLNNDLADYPVPVNSDIGEIEVGLLDRPDPILNSTGSKGLGEVAMVGAAAAVANGVFNATGRRMRRMPIRIEHML